MREKLTVIIPCYNALNYITDCLSSIKKQEEYVDEIIVVNDASTDGSAEMIEKAKETLGLEQLVLLCNDENCGAGYSRNRAVKVAHGDIISFVDADDILESNFYAEMLSALEKDKADIAVCDIRIYHENGAEVRHECKNTSGNTALSFIDTPLAASSCAKLFRKEVISSSPFNEFSVYEDIPAVLGALALSKNIAYTTKVCYDYYLHKGSVTEGLNKNILNIFTATDALFERINGCSEEKEIVSAVLKHQTGGVFTRISLARIPFNEKVAFFKEFRKRARKYKLHKNEHFLSFLRDFDPCIERTFLLNQAGFTHLAVIYARRTAENLNNM